MVSIIVPVYNCEERLSRCIESILNQTYRDIEVLLIDDGSNDNSGKICDKYVKSDGRVRVYHQENAGPSLARNRGIEMAKGKYLQFVDSDDYIEREMTESLVEALERNRTECAICGYVKEKQETRTYMELEGIGIVFLSEMDEFCPGIFGKDILNSPCNKLYIRNKIKEKFDASLSLGEDLLFNLDYLDGVEQVSYVPRPLYHYIEKEHSLTKQYRDNSIEIGEKLYIRCMHFISKHKMGYNAVLDVGRIFMKTVIYGCYDIYAYMKLNNTEKKALINTWIKNENVQYACKHAEFENMQQKLAAKLICCQDDNLLILFLRVKCLLSGMRK